MAASGEPKFSLRSAQKDVTRNRILDTARAVFQARGVSDVSMEDIAAEAGIGRTTIYLHFPRKEALLLDLLKSDWDRQAKLFERLTEIPRLTRAALREWVELMIRGMRETRPSLAHHSVLLSQEEEFSQLHFAQRERLIAILHRKHPSFLPLENSRDRRQSMKSHFMIYQMEQFSVFAAHPFAEPNVAAGVDVMVDTLFEFLTAK